MKRVLQSPMTGRVLSVASALSFFFTCMLLPLVGRAGSSVPYAAKNQRTFLIALASTIALAALASVAKWIHFSTDRGPLPLGSTAFCLICVALFVAQRMGLLAI